MRFQKNSVGREERLSTVFYTPWFCERGVFLYEEKDAAFQDSWILQGYNMGSNCFGGEKGLANWEYCLWRTQVDPILYSTPRDPKKPGSQTTLLTEIRNQPLNCFTVMEVNRITWQLRKSQEVVKGKRALSKVGYRPFVSWFLIKMLRAHNHLIGRRPYDRTTLAGREPCTPPWERGIK